LQSERKRELEGIHFAAVKSQVLLISHHPPSSTPSVQPSNSPFHATDSFPKLIANLPTIQPSYQSVQLPISLSLFLSLFLPLSLYFSLSLCLHFSLPLSISPSLFLSLPLSQKKKKKKKKTIHFAAVKSQVLSVRRVLINFLCQKLFIFLRETINRGSSFSP
jgi:hypothetical protein